jgi:hypothetical protein
MLRRTKDRPDPCVLDDAPRVHDGHAIAGLRDDAEIVGDEEQREAERPLTFAEEVQDLRLKRHVERCRRLVGHDERGLAGDGHGDEHPLAHAAGHLVGVRASGRTGIRNTYRVEQVDGAGMRLLPGGPAVDEQRLGDLTADGQHRVEGGRRFLEDQRNLRAADAAHFPLRQREQIAVPESGLAPAMRPGGGTSPRIESARTDFPLPDSPTRPSVSPVSMRRLTSSRAAAGPEGRSNTVVRCETVTRGAAVVGPASGAT